MNIEVQEWPIERCIPYARNPRKNDQVVEQMAGVIREFGFKIPILAKSDGSVVDGHLRLKAAALLDLKTIPVILCDEWTDAQVKAFRIMVNRSATWAEWDNELLALEMQDLKNEGYDLALTGFGEQEIAQLFAAMDTEAPEWTGMPEFSQEDKDAFRTIKVHFPDENSVIEFGKLVQQKISPEAHYIWFPRQPWSDDRKRRFSSEQPAAHDA